MASDIRVLIVDDVATDRELMRRAVCHGFPSARVTEAGDPAGWDAAIDGGRYDVILTDYWLTWATGIDLMRSVRARGLTCPVIVVTGTGNEQVAVEAIKEGVTDYLVKDPVGFARLPASIQAALAHQEEREQRAAADARNKRLIEELRASQAFTDKLLSSTSDLVYLFDLQSMSNVYMNPRIRQTLGYAPEEISALGPSLLATVLHPDDARWFMDEQVPRILAARDDETFVGIYRFRHRSGEWRWFRAHQRVFSRTASGEPWQLVGTAHDITAEREAEQALALATTAVTAAANGIVVTDVAGTIQWVNPAFCAMTGYTQGEVVGGTPRVLKSGLQGDGFYRGMWDTILRGRVWRGRLTNRKRDGSLYAEEMTITPVAAGGDRITHFVGIKNDITREEELQQRLRGAERMEAVGQLASGVAHDFNNMVTVVLGYCALLLDQIPETDPRRADVVAIMNANERAAGLTRQLLAFSRKQPLTPRAVDLNALVSDARTMLRRVLRADVQLDLQLSPGPVVAHVDHAQLEHALVNLVVNARDAIAGVGSVTVRTGVIDVDEAAAAVQPGGRPGTYAFVEVRDNGSGMTKDVLDHIFEPFFTTKALGKGTGLGLATVYGFVKQSNGFIWVTSTPGLGSTFTIQLPLEPRAAEAPGSRAPGPGGLPARSAHNRVVLVVDDDLVLAPLVSRILEGRGFEVLLALTPAEAIHLFEESRGAPDIVVTDVIMPQMSGPELAAHLGRLGYRGPVLYMSGYTDPADRRLAEPIAQGHFIAKPFAPRDLAERVLDLLELSSGEPS